MFQSWFRSLLGIVLVVMMTSAGCLAESWSATKPVHKTPAKGKPAVTKVAPAKKPENKPNPAANDPSYEMTDVMTLMKDPGSFMGKKIAFEGTFNTFTSLGLDYKPVKRDSKEYLSFLILRPDVDHHTIPLSELKLFLSRKHVNEAIDLESGDKILVKARMFSKVLGDPWMDVDYVKIVQKSPKNKADSSAQPPKH